jgi:hypothetical protein
MTALQPGGRGPHGILIIRSIDGCASSALVCTSMPARCLDSLVLSKRQSDSVSRDATHTCADASHTVCVVASAIPLRDGIVRAWLADVGTMIDRRGRLMPLLVVAA